MRLNECLSIEGNCVVFVPYKEHHVLRYNDWMQSTELQQLTASEPLTLQQEYEMQKSWHLDENKCTFILLLKEKWDDPECNEIDCMCGDVNLYFIDPDDSGVKTAEVEIMIAGATKLKVRRFIAKIGLQNQPSLALFKKLGFKQESVSEVFQEVTLQLEVTEEVQHSLNLQTNHMKYRDYKTKR
ncbi:N-acetyltransferase 9-like protein isoform X2 [Acanthaster planci]|uniref:N-acetyltransferase 9-like protein isoform X2 n=1 Tax=Acanthaster planci TaxID=133434 RepID=A0A8B7YK81_ACAPL|nr:N-acetyltransferase 9-like protein isoform X2 [Acanthaster planci]